MILYSLPHIIAWREVLNAHTGVSAVLAKTTAAGKAWLTRKLVE